MTYTIFISLEPYLAQWLIHEAGGEVPVHIKRGSAESDILELYLKHKPEDPNYEPQISPEEGQIAIALPWFKYKDIRTYNYLDEDGERRLRSCIRTRFLVMLWKDLMTVGKSMRRTDETIKEWMKEHGIDCDDRNWNTIAKILQRKRAIYGPIKKNSQKIVPSSFHFCPPCDLLSPESNQ